MLFRSGTKKGRCFWMKCYDIPEGDRHSKGRAIQNMLALDPDDSVNAFLRIRGLEDEDFLDSHYIVFVTKKGLVKKTSLRAYSRPRTNGVIAININEGDEVVDVRLTNGSNELIIATISYSLPRKVLSRRLPCALIQDHEPMVSLLSISMRETKWLMYV